MGNLRACLAALYRLPAGSLEQAVLERSDPYHGLCIGVRATRPPVARAPAVGLVLAYHRVTPEPIARGAYFVRPDLFRAQLAYLASTYRLLPLDQLLQQAACGQVLPGSVALTFDDGYLDALQYASPALVEAGVPATFFVTTGQLEHEHELWSDRIDRVLLQEPSLPDAPLIVDGIALPTRKADERAQTCQRLFELGYAADAPRRDTLVACVEAWFGRQMGPRASHRVLTAPEVLTLTARPGHAIGAHTEHHLALPRRPAAEQLQDLCNCRKRLESLLQRPVRSLAYPYGEYDASTVELARKAGYTAALKIEAGTVSPNTDPMLLPRLEVQNAPLETFVAQVQRAFERTS
jgi:peptidoglycan/xylan/chitin deacetylase (PgdA/CDA1 family)